MLRRVRSLFDRKTFKKDALAGVVLGGQSVPDGLAGGLLAGVNSVVIVRLRGRTGLGSTLIDHLAVAGVTEAVGEENFYRSDEWLGKTMRRAHEGARSWIAKASG